MTDGTDGAGFGPGGAGSASDPASVAFFNQSIGDRVLFAVDQSTLSAEAQSILAAQAQWLLSNPEYVALVEGHADEQGTREIQPCPRRPPRVGRARLPGVARRAQQPALSTVSYGKERPLEICSDEACYSQNRRAVTVVSAGTGV